MIIGKKANSPTGFVMDYISEMRKKKGDQEIQRIENAGIPLIFSQTIETVKITMQSLGIPPEKQQEWEKVENQFLHWIRLLYTDMTEEEIIKRFGPIE